MAPSDIDSIVSGEWPGRLRVLLGAALELASPHDRKIVLQRIVEGAASVADAAEVAAGRLENVSLVQADTLSISVFRSALKAS